METYKAVFSLRLRSVIKEVSELEDSINKTMNDFGCDEKFFTEAECFTATITTEKELTDEEQYKMKALLNEQVIKNMPKYDIRLKSFSCQPKQEVLQSVE